MQAILARYCRSIAHTLNLIVADAVNSVQLIIDKYKLIVTYFKRSTSPNIKVIKYQNQSGVEIPKNSFRRWLLNALVGKIIFQHFE